jgi:hypothetical protein
MELGETTPFQSYNFDVCTEVQEIINRLPITDEEEVTIRRCIGGYSSGKDWTESLTKTKYTIEQWNQSYPDWNESVRLLDTKKVTTSASTNNNSSVPLFGNMFPTSHADSDHLLQNSGLSKLRMYIEMNSKKPV